MFGTVYLIHLDRPVNPTRPAQHYLGWALDVAARLRQHRAGSGAALLRAAVERGIAFEVVATWPGTRHTERRAKNLKATPRLCPICGTAHPGGRLHLPLRAVQLALPFDEAEETDPFGLVAAPSWRADWYEVWYRRSFVRATWPATVRSEDCLIPF